MQKELGDYRILREIARGGMGVVYLAEQTSLKRRVALKVLPFASSGGSRQVRRFRREAEAAGKLHHPNIVPIYDVGEQEGTYFFSMEYIEGRTLDSVIDDLRWSSKEEVSHEDLKSVYSARGSEVVERETKERIDPVPEGEPRVGRNFVLEAVRIVRELARALHYAHGLGVIHRDVKPSNIILDGDGKPHLMDFGLARDEDDSAITLSGDVFGTPKYMSPEQIRARRSDIDSRTDLYSLGVTLYELVTLRLPYSGESSQEILKKILTVPPIRPGQVNKSLPSDLETIILKTLEKSPQDRYASAGELADDLDRFLNYEAILAKPPHPMVRFGRVLRRSRARMSFGISLLLLVVALGTWLMARKRTALRVTSKPAGATVIVDGTHCGTTPLENYSLSPGGHQVSLYLDQHESYEEKVTIPRGQVFFLNWTFKERAFRLGVPKGEAWITLLSEDGGHQIKKQEAGKPIPIPYAGMWTVRLEKENSLPVVGRVEIKKDGSWGNWESIEGPVPYQTETGEYQVDPIENVGLLQVHVNSEAHIVVEGEESPDPAVEFKDRSWQCAVSPGPYSVEVVDLNYHRDEKKVEIRRDDRREVNLAVERVLWDEYPTLPTRFEPVLFDRGGDGQLQIVVFSEKPLDSRQVGQVLILRENRGRLLLEKTYQLPLGVFLGPPSIIDFDRDGHPEIVAAAGDNGHRWVQVLSLGPDQTALEFPIELGPGALSDPIVADLDLNGHPDFALGVSKGGIEILWGAGSGPEKGVLEVPELEVLGRECVDLTGNDGIPEFLGYESSGELVARSSQDGTVRWRRSISGSPFEVRGRGFSGESGRNLPFFAVTDVDQRNKPHEGGDAEVVVRTERGLSVWRGEDGLERQSYPIEFGTENLRIQTPFVVGDVWKGVKGEEILVPTRAGIDVLAYGERIARLPYPDGLDPEDPGRVRISLGLAPLRSDTLDLILVLGGQVYGLDPGRSDEVRVLFQFGLEEGEFYGPSIGDLDDNGTLEVVGSGSDGAVYCLTGSRPQKLWRWDSPHTVRHGFRLGHLNRDGVPDLAIVETAKDLSGDGEKESHRLVMLSGRTGEEIRDWKLPADYRGVPEFLDVDGDGIDEVLLHLEVEGGGVPHPVLAVVPRGPERTPLRADLRDGRGRRGGDSQIGVGWWGHADSVGVLRFDSNRLEAANCGLSSADDLGKPHHLMRAELPEILWTLDVEELPGVPSRFEVPRRPGVPELQASSPVVRDLSGDGVSDLLVVVHRDHDDADGTSLQLVALDGSDGSLLWEGPTAGARSSFEISLCDVDVDGKLDVLVAIRRGNPASAAEGLGSETRVSEVYAIHGARGTALFAVDLDARENPVPVTAVATVTRRRGNFSLVPDLVCVTEEGRLEFYDTEEVRRRWTIDLEEGDRWWGEEAGARVVTALGEREFVLFHRGNLVSLVSVGGRTEEWRYAVSPGRRQRHFVRNVQAMRPSRHQRRKTVIVQEQLTGRVQWASVTAYQTQKKDPYLWSPGCPSATWARRAGTAVELRRRLDRGEPIRTFAERMQRKIDPSDPLWSELERLVPAHEKKKPRGPRPTHEDRGPRGARKRPGERRPD